MSVRIKSAQFRSADGCLRYLEPRRMEPSSNSFANPLVPAPPKTRRRVGRPKGSKGRVMLGARVLRAIQESWMNTSCCNDGWAIEPL